MPGKNQISPSVSISFSNCFWGKNDEGTQVLMDRMRQAKHTCEELRTYYQERAIIEEDYSKKLLKLAKGSLGSSELGGLKQSLESVRNETESISAVHMRLSHQIRSELLNSLNDFAVNMRDRRKLIQSSVEKIHRRKLQQEQQLIRAKEKYDSDCVKINGYIAQQNMLMGKDLEKNNIKLEKTQANVQISNREYQDAVLSLRETTERWNRDWKEACDKIQDMEEDRIDFIKANAWAFANVVSVVCVSDDEACERIRMSLEKCEVEKDIQMFIKEHGTGQVIAMAPQYCNFYRGVQEPQDDHKIAQFARHGNPQYRSSTLSNIDNRDLARQSPTKTTINQHPPEGMTQFCRTEIDTLVNLESNNINLANVSPIPSSIYSNISHFEKGRLGLSSHQTSKKGHSTNELNHISSQPLKEEVTSETCEIVKKRGRSRSFFGIPFPGRDSSKSRESKSFDSISKSPDELKTKHKMNEHLQANVRKSLPADFREAEVAASLERFKLNDKIESRPKIISNTPQNLFQKSCDNDSLTSTPTTSSLAFHDEKLPYNYRKSSPNCHQRTTSQGFALKSRNFESDIIKQDCHSRESENNLRYHRASMVNLRGEQKQFDQSRLMDYLDANEISIWKESGSETSRVSGRYADAIDSRDEQGHYRSRSANDIRGINSSSLRQKVLFNAVAIFDYKAAIPEEMGFKKGEIFSILRTQEDGWWFGEVTNQRERSGLVPSNFLKTLKNQ